MWEGLSESWHVWLGAWSSLLAPALSSKLYHLSVAELGFSKRGCKSKWRHQHVCSKNGAADAVALQFESVCRFSPSAVLRERKAVV